MFTIWEHFIPCYQAKSAAKQVEVERIEANKALEADKTESGSRL